MRTFDIENGIAQLEARTPETAALEYCEDVDSIGYAPINRLLFIEVTELGDVIIDGEEDTDVIGHWLVTVRVEPTEEDDPGKLTVVRSKVLL